MGCCLSAPGVAVVDAGSVLEEDSAGVVVESSFPSAAHLRKASDISSSDM